MKLVHALLLLGGLLTGRRSGDAQRRHTNIHSTLKLVVLPLEDTHVMETDRLERCPTYQAYLDPVTEKVNFIPLCAWELHNKRILREISEHYAAGATAGS